MAKSVEKTIQSRATPYVLITAKGDIPNEAVDTIEEPSVRFSKVQEAVVLPKAKAAHRIWLAELRITGPKDAKWFCFELEKGCLLYGRTIVATRGKVQVWGSRPDAKYLGGSGKRTVRPAVGLEKKLRWGKPIELDLGR